MVADRGDALEFRLEHDTAVSATTFYAGGIRNPDPASSVVIDSAQVGYDPNRLSGRDPGYSYAVTARKDALPW